MTKKDSSKHIKTSLNYIKSTRFNELLIKLVIIIFFLIFTVGIIGYAKGMRFDLQKQTLQSTGILAISSSPKAAKVYIDGQFKGATDLNLTLPPGVYRVEIQKDGYTSYTTSIALKGELVETVDPVLFPINPSLSPLTNLGVVKAVQVDQSDKILLFSDNQNTEKDGVYLFETTSGTLTLFPPLATLVLKSSLPSDITFDNPVVHFSYDFKQVVVDFQTTNNTVRSFLISLDSEKQTPLEVTQSKDTLLRAWDDQHQKDMVKILEAFPKEIRPIASDSFSIVSYSPDQTKILYKAKERVNLPLVISPPLIASDQTQEERDLQLGGLYVYDRKEDKNFKISSKDIDNSTMAWYPDSKRIVFNEGKQITIALYDGTAKQIVYSGPINEGFFAVNSDGKLLILANLNPLSNKLPDIYAVGIR